MAHYHLCLYTCADLPTAVVPFYWNATEEQKGETIVCFIARDGRQALSTPQCLVVVVVTTVAELEVRGL